MIKTIFLSAAIGVIAITAAVPVVIANSRSLGEPAAMLLAATAFFGLAGVMRTGPRRR